MTLETKVGFAMAFLMPFAFTILLLAYLLDLMLDFPNKD